MVWGAFSVRGKSELAFVTGRQDSTAHCETLSDTLLPFLHEHYLTEDGVEAVFQQDNASIHTSRETRRWLEEQDFEIMGWPAKSPDLNPIENLWGILVQKIYVGGKQYKDEEALKVAILKAWDEIDQSTLNALINSMEKRLDECIKLKGAKTHY
jgi:transposase